MALIPFQTVDAPMQHASGWQPSQARLLWLQDFEAPSPPEEIIQEETRSAEAN